MYRFISRLETGELSELYRAESLKSDPRDVIVKLFHVHTSDAAYAQSIGETAVKMQGVSHAGVLHPLSLGMFDRRFAVIREDVGGVTLGQALTRLNTREVHLPPQLALAIIIELAEAIHAAHEAGVVHSALTPGNVIISDVGQVYATDFGARDALEASTALGEAFSQSARSSYMAPELRSGSQSSVAGDIYALGAIAYELLTLKEASTGRSVSTRAERLPPPSRLVRRLNARVDSIILKSLEHAAARRCKSSLELATALREFLSSSGAIPGRDELASFVEELFPKDVTVGSGVLSALPFTSPVALRPLENLPELREAAISQSTRAPFSGGEVDPAESVIVDESLVPEAAKTEPEMSQVEMPSWSAPGAELPLPHTAPAEPTSLRKRLKQVGDLKVPGADTQPIDQGRVGKVSRARKTIRTFVAPFTDTDVKAVQPTQETPKPRIGLAVVFLSLGAIAMGAGLAVWLAPDRLRAAVFNAATHTPATPEESPTITVVRGTDVPSTEVVARRPCFDPPTSGGRGILNVSTDRRVRLTIDGAPVCVELKQIPVTVGTHAVTVTDLQTSSEFSATVRVDNGGVARVAPNFKLK